MYVILLLVSVVSSTTLDTVRLAASVYPPYKHNELRFFVYRYDYRLSDAFCRSSTDFEAMATETPLGHAVIDVDKIPASSVTEVVSGLCASGLMVCEPSKRFVGYKRCVWTSARSLPLGQYDIRIVACDIPL